MTLSQLRGELPSCVWRVSIDTGEVLAYVTGDNPADMLTRAARIKKLRHQSPGEMKFRRLTVRDVIRLRGRGMVFH